MSVQTGKLNQFSKGKKISPSDMRMWEMQSSTVCVKA